MAGSKRWIDHEIVKGTIFNDISIPEQSVCEGLAPLLRAHGVGDSLNDTDNAQGLLSAFEFFLPEVLCGVHNEWRHESLDGVYPHIFRKTGDREVELLGLALFISDQTLTPVYFELQLSPAYDRVAWIDLRLGEHWEGGCRREPYASSKVWGKKLLQVADRSESIDWYYHVGYGERQP